MFGGNFIHSFNIERQFKICDIEERTRVRWDRNNEIKLVAYRPRQEIEL